MGLFESNSFRERLSRTFGHDSTMRASLRRRMNKIRNGSRGSCLVKALKKSALKKSALKKSALAGLLAKGAAAICKYVFKKPLSLLRRLGRSFRLPSFRPLLDGLKRSYQKMLDKHDGDSDDDGDDDRWDGAGQPSCSHRCLKCGEEFAAAGADERRRRRKGRLGLRGKSRRNKTMLRNWFRTVATGWADRFADWRDLMRAKRSGVWWLVGNLAERLGRRISNKGDRLARGPSVRSDGGDSLLGKRKARSSPVAELQ